MVKLVIQIPCLNEEETLPPVLQTIPKKIPGIDEIEIVVIDDGCSDQTVQVAKKLGVKHFVHHPRKQGLARSFHDGVIKCLELGADIIVNTDGDNQYPSQDIPELVRPILEGRADIVIANRQVQMIDHFSRSKKLLQRFGTYVLNLAAGTKIPDAPSGFRAYSKEAAIRINTVTNFSYTMETIIQAANKQLSIESIPIKVNAKTRESRLFKSNWEHIAKSGAAIFRAFVMYRPYVIFLTLGAVLLAIGAVPFLRYLYFTIVDHTGGARHLQSLIAGTVLVVASLVAFTLGIIADLIRINRVLIEDALEHQKHLRFDKNADN
ncbi:MAG TPA: glycosyltransferase family 2 protein [Patescibacteria group bacterium]|nr:glycosyltransferase family 2 protein [Patescibacteria group bacterium]